MPKSVDEQQMLSFMPNERGLFGSGESRLLRAAVVLISLFSLQPFLMGQAPPISLIQKATFSRQPSSSGIVTLALPQATGAGHTLIVGVSFWPLDLASVTDSSGDSFFRGLTASIYHNVSQGVMYTNFYYAKSTAGGATTLTLHFSGGSTFVVVAVSEVAGLDLSAPLDQSGYHESLTSTSPWSSASLTTATPNEYLFAWAADEWNNPSCSNPTEGWTQTQNTAEATLCLLDRTTLAAGSYQVSVTPSTAFNYAMEIVAFKGASSSPTPSPAPLVISTASLPSGTVGAAYLANLAATGGSSPYTWSASGLPAGLSINSSGTISGTPTTAGTFTAAITVLDSTNAKATQNYSMSVAAAPAPPPISSSITVIQRATLNQQPSSNGTVTLTLPKATAAGHALIVGVSFWPLDLASVTDSSSDSFFRGLTASIYHNVSQGVMYTNFYYAKSTAGGATTLTLHFSGGSTFVVVAVSEVAGLDPSAPLDKSGYHESLSSTSPWSSAALTTSAANEYLFAWAADEWNNPSCSNPTSGWTETQNTSGATLCLLDRAVSTVGSNQVTVTPSTAFNYAMEIVAFKGAALTAKAPGMLSSSSSNLAFGSVNVGASSTLSATYTNSGGSGVTVSSVSVSGSGFNLSGISVGQIITVGQTATLSVTFAPAARGNVTGGLTITSNASNSPLTISFSGTGIVVSHSANLSWTASTSVVVGYNVYRSSISGGPYTKLNSSPDAKTTFTDGSVVSGQTYYYVVTAVDPHNVESSDSNQVTAVIP